MRRPLSPAAWPLLLAVAVSAPVAVGQETPPAAPATKPQAEVVTDPPVGRFAGPPGVTEIRRALEEATKLEFVETPLRDALAFLSDYQRQTGD